MPRDGTAAWPSWRGRANSFPSAPPLRGSRNLRSKFRWAVSSGDKPRSLQPHSLFPDQICQAARCLESVGATRGVEMKGARWSIVPFQKFSRCIYKISAPSRKRISSGRFSFFLPPLVPVSDLSPCTSNRHCSKTFHHAPFATITAEDRRKGCSNVAYGLQLCSGSFG
jgi:hypothetical protein